MGGYCPLIVIRRFLRRTSFRMFISFSFLILIINFNYPHHLYMEAILKGLFLKKIEI